MLGDTITFTVNAVAKIMSKINQDSYSAEYLLRETTQEWRLKIRHSKDKADKNGVVNDRHVVDFTQTIYPVSPSTVGETRRAYLTIVNSTSADATAVKDDVLALCAYMTSANTLKVIGWES